MRGAKVDIWAYIEAMKEYLEAGYSIERAARLAGKPPRTVHDHYTKDEEVRAEIDRLMENGNYEARKKWIKNIKAGNQWAIEHWLEKRDPDFKPGEAGTTVNVTTNVVQETNLEDLKTKEDYYAYFDKRLKKNDK